MGHGHPTAGAPQPQSAFAPVIPSAAIPKKARRVNFFIVFLRCLQVIIVFLVIIDFSILNNS